MAKAPFDDDIFDDDDIEDVDDDEDETQEKENDDDGEEEFDDDSGDRELADREEDADEDDIEEEDGDGSADDDEEIDDEEDNIDPPEQPKRKPGRPPKKKTGKTSEKRKPGRPKKSDNKDDEGIKVIDEDEDSIDDEKGTSKTSTNKVQQGTPRRRRPIDTEDEDEDEEINVEPSDTDLESTENIVPPPADVSTNDWNYMTPQQDIFEGHNIEDDRKLNRYRLDEEAEKQADLYGFYAERLATAKASRDAARGVLDYTENSVALKVREKPPKDIKVTDSSIANIVGIDPDVQTAKRNYLVAQATVNKLEAAVTSMEHRRSQIKNLTMLWIGGYYSIPGSTREDEQTSNISSAMRDKLKTRTRDQFEDEENGEED